MKKMRILSLILALVMLFAVGCSSTADEPAPANDDQQVIAKTEEETPEATDEPSESTASADAAMAFLGAIPSDIYMIGSADLFAKMDAGEDVFILDIRQNDVYSESHLKGAINVPWGPDFAAQIPNLPADKTIYIYCYSGQTANQTNAMLNILGYDAKSVKYGWNFGISATEGYEAYSEVEANEFGEETALDVHPEVMADVEAYYAGLADVADGIFKNYKISEDNANANIGNEDFYYLSIRQEKDYNQGHIPTASVIPYGADMVDALGTLPMDKTIVVNCYSGQTAGQVVGALRLAGYDAVSVNGGLGTKGNGSIGYGKHYPLVSTISEAAASIMNNKPDHSYLIGSADVFTMMDNQEDMFILDIRQNDVYTESHLKGAVNLPWGPDFAASIEMLPVDKPIMVYCYSGQTAGQTVGVLNTLGYDARSIKYGWNFGISKTEGYEAYSEVEANEFGSENTKELGEYLLGEATAYYAGLADVADTTYKNYKISEQDTYDAAMAADGSVVFLDIRKAADYANGHIPGAINVPYGTSMVAGLADLPMDKKIVVNCYSGQTAGQAVAVMKFMGYDAVSVNGGMGTPANAPLGYVTKGFATEQ